MAHAGGAFDRFTRFSEDRLAARCRMVRAQVYRVESGEGGWFPGLAGHVSTCLDCQAEVARQRLVLRGLRQVGDESLRSPIDLSVGGFEALRPKLRGSERWMSRRRRVSPTALASVSAAAIGVAWVAGRRMRSAIG